MNKKNKKFILILYIITNLTFLMKIYFSKAFSTSATSNL